MVFRTIALRMLALPTLLTLAALSHAQSHKTVFGWVEKATLEPWGVTVKAKLDTGALTSSLTAHDIERFEKDGKHWVRFTVRVEDQRDDKKVSKKFEKPVYRNVIIRGAGGEEHRPVVLMKICMAHTIHEEQFTLEDRSDMLYPVLIGRRTIQHLGVVDVTHTFLHDPDCDDDSPVKKFNPKDSDEDIGA